MMRSLYSGVTGLRNHQTRMDVIGNNIANVNTVGFKASRVTFNDIYSETIRSGSRTNESMGGQNPMQIGLGMAVSSIDVMHGRSAAMLTSMPLDVSIAGDGFFVVSSTPESAGLLPQYTRAGNFQFDAPELPAGTAVATSRSNLLDANGNFVLGYMLPIGEISLNAEMPTYQQVVAAAGGDATVPKAALTQVSVDFNSYDNISIDASGAIVGRVKPPNGGGEDGMGPPAGNNDAYNNAAIRDQVGQKVILGWVAVATFANPTGLQKEGNNLYSQSPASGDAMTHTAGSPDTNAGILNPGTLEMSNVDIAAQFTDMIVTQRGFQANSRIITVSDSMLEELVNIKR